MALTITAYILAIRLVIKERFYILPTGPTFGHGFALVMFFALVFISENISLVNLNRADWWFHPRTFVKLNLKRFLINFKILQD